jgi:rod shape determining protein RodA
MNNKLLTIDLPLFLSLLLLNLLGLFFLYSSSNENLNYVTNQFYKIVIGFIFMLIISKIPSSYIRIATPYLFAFTLFLLFLVVIIGINVNGAKRWLDLGFFRFQPSEIAKISVILFISWFIHEKGLLKNKENLTMAFLIVLLPTVFILLQPDLGSSLMVLISAFSIIFIGGLPWLFIGMLCVFLVFFIPFSWFFILRDYQKERILTLFNPEMDPLGNGYHIIQSKIAIGSGGVEGLGWLKGLQTQLGYVPEQHTDFIFSAIAEEMGLLGSVFIMAIYLFIIYRIFTLSKKMDFLYHKLTTIGFMSVIAFYAFVNICMVIGILPVVGLPLPFISYGGTSLLLLFIMLGIISSFYNSKF